MSQKTQNYIYILSGLIVIASAIAHILTKEFAIYSYGVGAIGMTFIKIKNLHHSNNFRIRRLQKIQAISVILLLGTTYLMYIHHNAWAITLVLSAIMDLIVSFRMPKEKEED